MTLNDTSLNHSIEMPPTPGAFLSIFDTLPKGKELHFQNPKHLTLVHGAGLISVPSWVELSKIETVDMTNFWLGFVDEAGNFVTRAISDAVIETRPAIFCVEGMPALGDVDHYWTARALVDAARIAELPVPGSSSQQAA
jgi:hypothetical protein